MVTLYVKDVLDQDQVEFLCGLPGTTEEKLKTVDGTLAYIKEYREYAANVVNSVNSTVDLMNLRAQVMTALNIEKKLIEIKSEREDQAQSIIDEILEMVRA